jgi:hypothetical protein
MVAHSEPKPNSDPLTPARAARQHTHLHNAGTDALIRDLQALSDRGTPAPVVARIGLPSAPLPVAERIASGVANIPTR